MQLNDMNLYIFHHLKAYTKLILHAHKILKEGSSKVAIHSPSGDY